MLNYTGHPLVDVGVATITAFADKRDPTGLTKADLDQIVGYIEREYTRKPLKSFLIVAFTNNVWFFQNAYNPDKPNLTDEEREQRQRKREKWARRHLKQWSADTKYDANERGVFTSEPAISVALSKKLRPGRAGRAQVPLLLGDENINFYANGVPGVPVGGKALLALQAFPLGCGWIGKKLLAVHSDNPELTFHFAASFLNENRRAIQLTHQISGAKDLSKASLSYRTLLIEKLLEADQMQREEKAEERPFSITAYLLNNQGRSASIEIFYLPLEITGFLRDMQSAEYHVEWQALVRQAWDKMPTNEVETQKAKKSRRPQRNWLYEDLFDLAIDIPERAPRFIRTYFLRSILQSVEDATRQGQGVWKITARSLWRILNMDKERIEQIRKLGDQLADYVSSQNDRRFFREFYTVRRYYHLRTALIKANLAYVKQGNAPIITLDPYVEVFEEGNELARPDWQLARDLVLIRMVERLYEQGWLGSNVDAIPESIEEESESA